MITVTSSTLRMTTLGADDNIAAISTSNQALCDLTAGRRHVVYSTGITAPNLPVMKTQLERKKKERDHDHGVPNSGCWKQDEKD